MSFIMIESLKIDTLFTHIFRYNIEVDILKGFTVKGTFNDVYQKIILLLFHDRYRNIGVMQFTNRPRFKGCGF